MATTIAISNQKGGVGKTTTAMHIAAALTLAGNRTLLIDLDSQANATTGLGVAEATDQMPGSYHAIVGDEVATPEWCVESVMHGLKVLPASLHLAGVDLEIGDQSDAVTRLKTSIAALGGEFDWIILDCPPSLGVLSVNALAAADEVLTPLPPERFAIDGLARLQATMHRLRDSGKIKVPDPTIMLTRTQPWSDGHIQRSIALRNEARDRVLVAEAPLSPGLETACDHRRPIYMENPDTAGGDAYLSAASEMMLRRTGLPFGATEVMDQVSAMKAEIARRYPRPEAPETPRGYVVQKRPSWLTRQLAAFRQRKSPTLQQDGAAGT